MTPASQNNFFRNFESYKLTIENPDTLNILLLIVFFSIALLSAKRVANPSQFLDRSQTDQLKGMAILWLIVGHLWVHVASTSANIVLSGEAVALFLILSGFGLTLSFKKQALDFNTFLTKRVKRVMVPYWIGTVFLLTFDFLILGKTYSIGEMLMTSLGLNLTTTIKHIDYVRWFVTFILMWYFLFYFVMSSLSHHKAIIFLFICAILLLPIHYYFLHFGWYQFVAFPIGCACGVFYQDLQKLYFKKRRMFGLLALLGATWVMLYKIAYNFESIKSCIWAKVPSIFLIALDEFNSIVLCFALIIGLGYLGFKQYKSRFLALCGKYSYELYLLHGAFLIKYNFFFKSDNLFSILIGFSIFVIFLLVLAKGLSKLTRIFI